MKGNKIFLLGLMHLVFFLTISTVIFSDDYSDVDFGCCIYDSYCSDIHGAIAIKNCEESAVFEKGVMCNYNPLNPTIPFVKDDRCKSTGCCCFDSTKTFISNLASDECSAKNGNYVAAQNCNAACGYEELGGDITCTSLNGFYCDPSDIDSFAVELTGINNYSDRANDNLKCYNLPCIIENSNDCNKGDFDFEVYCSDGVNNDGDCLIDTADDDCAGSIRGTVVNKKQNGAYLGVSNVRIKIKRVKGENYDSEVFYTYTVGSEGRYYYSGIPSGNYLITVDDDYFESYTPSSSSSYKETKILTNNDLEKTADFIVRPKNVIDVIGKVTQFNSTGGIDPPGVVAGAIVVLENTNFYTKTDKSGKYVLKNIPLGSYNAIAYKEGFIPNNLNFAISDFSKSGKHPIGDIFIKNNSCKLNPPSPIIDSIDPIQGVDQVEIKFHSDRCNPTSYIIRRCDSSDSGSSCTDDLTGPQYVKISNDPISIKKNFFIDKGINGEGLGWDKEYYYIITAIYGDSGEETVPDQYFKVFTGNVECKDKQNVGEFCNFLVSGDGLISSKVVYSSFRVSCDERNLLSTKETCDDSTKCFEVNSGEPNSKTECRELDSCSPEEHNFFGLFYDLNNCQGKDDSKFCVYDYSKTIANNCRSCKYISGCSDYRSEDSCIGTKGHKGDPCGVGNCEWKYTNKELKVGICYDKVKSDCNSCNYPFNKVFGKCTVTSCELSGDCSLNKETSTCTDCKDMFCYAYVGEDQCGSRSRIILNKENGILYPSDDSCGLGFCIWDSVKENCFKDADGDGVDDCGSVFSNDERRITASPPYLKEYCKKDVTPPSTLLFLNKTSFNPLAPINGEIFGSFSSVDKVPGEFSVFEPRDIYFCIEPEGEDQCNSKGSFNRAHRNEKGYYIDIKSIDGSSRVSPGVGNNVYTLRGGLNKIKYFAKDFSSNVEKIKEGDFYVDFSAPEIEITVIKKPLFGEYRTDVSIIANSNENVYCYVELSDCEEVGNCDPHIFDEKNITSAFIDLHAGEFSKNFVRDYYSLSDGMHFLNVVCTDTSGNIYKKAEEMILDTDPRIFDPKPKGVTEKTSVILSVMTLEDVQCRFSSSLNSDFESMPGLMDSAKSGSYYKHTALINLDKDDQYSYYVRCNYDPIALEKISFSLDTEIPTSDVLLDGFFPIPKNGWVQYGAVQVICKDKPEYGFGCNSSHYCLVDPPNIRGVNLLGNCTPNLLYTGKLDLSEPKTICYKSTENKYSGNGVVEGGRSSSTICKNIFVDKSDPNLFIYPFPLTTNKNKIEVHGSVFDSINSGSLVFSNTDDYTNNFFDSANYSVAFSHDITTNVFDYSLDIDFTNLGKIINDSFNSKIKILLGNGSKYGAIVFNLAENKIQLINKGFISTKELDSVIITDSFYNGKKNIRISYNGGNINAYIQSIENPSEQITLKGKINAVVNSVGVLIEDRDEMKVTIASSGSFGSPVLFSADDLNLDKDIYFKVNNELREIKKTNGDFYFNHVLNLGTPAHGDSYEVSLFAEDLSGRKSSEFTNIVTFDLSGPEFISFDFTPRGEQSSGYLEYGYDADFEIKTKDDYSGVSRVQVSIGDLENSLSFDSSTNTWKGMVSTSMLPIGTHDLEIIMYDGLGNYNKEVVKNAFTIEDRLEPTILIDLNNSYYNSDTPVVRIETDEEADCSMHYKSSLGNTIYIDFSPGFSFKHSAKLTEPLFSEKGKEIKNKLYVECKDQSGNIVSQIIPIIVDLKKPVYTIQTQDVDFKKYNIRRHESSYFGFYGSDKTLYFKSDEPVKCKYVSSSEEIKTAIDYASMSESFKRTSLNEFAFNDVTPDFYLVDKQEKYFNVICKDRSGNEGVLKKLNFKVDSDAPPYIFDVPKYIGINSTSSAEDYSFSFRSIRPLDCRYEIGNSGFFDIKYSSQGQNSFSYNVDLFEAMRNSEGRFLVNIECRLEGSSSNYISKKFPFIRDISVPRVIPSDSNSLADYFEGGFTILNSTESLFYLYLDFNENITIKVLLNGKLILFEENTDSIMSLIPLKYGYNKLKITAYDEVGNTIEGNIPILSSVQTPRVFFSNSLSGSKRDSYSGSVFISEHSMGSLSLVISKHIAGLENNKILLKDLTYDGTQNGLERYNFTISRSELYSLLNKKTSLKELTIDERDNLDFISDASEPINFEVLLYDNPIYTETLFYDPLAESILFYTPKYNVIKESDLENYNKIRFTGELNNENYIESAIYSFGDSSEKKDLNNVGGVFNFSELIKSNSNKIYLELVNDLGISTIIDSELLLASKGPTPSIKLYPEGDVVYYGFPKFKIDFKENPAKILSAYVVDERLEHNYSVSFSSDFNFVDILQTIDELPKPGKYKFNLLSVDENGIKTGSYFYFEYKEKDFDLELISPKYGVSSSPNFEVVFKSDRLAKCRYSFNSSSFEDMRPISNSFVSTHTFNLNISKETNVFVICEEFGGKISPEKRFSFDYDTTPPIIENINLVNSENFNGRDFITGYPLEARYVVTADEDVYCRYDFSKDATYPPERSFNNMNDVSIRECNSVSEGIYCFEKEQQINLGNLENNNIYNVSIVCQNKAGLDSNYTSKTFQVDITKGDLITIISPSKYESSKSFDIKIRTNAPNNNCKYGFSSEDISNLFLSHSNDSLIHLSRATVNSFGNYVVYVSCEVAGKNITESKEFVIDDTPPKAGSILQAETSYVTSRLTATAINFTDDESGILEYRYTIGIGPCGKKGYNSIKNWTQSKSRTFSETHLDLNDQTTYYFCVKAVNGALKESKEVSSKGIFIDLSSFRIVKNNTNSSNSSLDNQHKDSTSDHCSDHVKNEGESGVDCGSVCDSPCPEGTSCLIDSDCYDSSLGCINGECTFIGLTNTINNSENNSISLGESSSIERNYDETQSVSKSLTWIYWLLVIFLLAVFVGGGYYVYILNNEEERKKQDIINKANPNYGLSSEDLAKKRADALRQKQLEERKEEIKKALKRKLVNDMKKESLSQRHSLFDEFDSNKITGSTVIPSIRKKEDGIIESGRKLNNNNNNNNKENNDSSEDSRKTSRSSGNIDLSKNMINKKPRTAEEIFKENKLSDEEEEKRKKELQEKILRLKKALKEHNELGSHFKYTPKGENILDKNLRETHKDIVSSKDNFNYKKRGKGSVETLGKLNGTKSKKGVNSSKMSSTSMLKNFEKKAKQNKVVNSQTQKLSDSSSLSKLNSLSKSSAVLNSKGKKSSSSLEDLLSSDIRSTSRRGTLQTKKKTEGKVSSDLNKSTKKNSRRTSKKNSLSELKKMSKK